MGQEARSVKNKIFKWLHHFGLTSSSSSVVLHTDAEHAVSEFVATSTVYLTTLNLLEHLLNHVGTMHVHVNSYETILNLKYNP